MHIRLRDSGRDLEGTAVEIVKQMRDNQFGADDIEVSEFVDQVVARTKKWFKIDLKVEGQTGEEKAEKLVDSMIEAGLAEHVDSE